MDESYPSIAEPQMVGVARKIGRKVTLKCQAMARGLGRSAAVRGHARNSLRGEDALRARGGGRAGRAGARRWPWRGWRQRLEPHDPGTLALLPRLRHRPHRLWLHRQ